ncbi:hypothetical protein Tco_0731898 [Tanacetum coccineum]
MVQQVLNQIVEDLLVIVKKLLVLEMIVDKSLEMIKDESLEMIKDESLDIIVDETLKLDEILSRLIDVGVNFKRILYTVSQAALIRSRYRASQSIQHGHKLDSLESRKSPTKSCMMLAQEGFHRHCEILESYHSDYSGLSQG